MSDSNKKESSELKRYFDIEVLPSDTQPIVESKIKKIAKTMKAPGFRPGKVPIDIVKQTHELEVQSDAINEVINKNILRRLKNKIFNLPVLQIFNLLSMIKTPIRNQISWYLERKLSYCRKLVFQILTSSL